MHETLVAFLILSGAFCLLYVFGVNNFLSLPLIAMYVLCGMFQLDSGAASLLIVM